MIFQLAEGLKRRREAEAMRMWKQTDKLEQLKERIKQHFIDDVFVAWKRRVAFKGGHSIHNRALRCKAWQALDKYRKISKVKRFRQN